MKKKIMPPTFFIILLLLSLGFHFVFPVFKFVFLPYNYTGVVLIIFGIVINLWTDSLFKKNQTTVKPHKTPNFFITNGPFRLSRHPMYLGMASILIGESIILGSLISFIFPIIFIIIINYFLFLWKKKTLKKSLLKNILNTKIK